MQIDQIVDMSLHQLDENQWCEKKRTELQENGAIKLQNFLTANMLVQLQKEAQLGLGEAYFNPQSHNIYLTPPDPAFDATHIRNRLVKSSKGCITDDQIADNSPLKQLYHNKIFIKALCHILEEQALFDYADSLSSVNIHYANEGEELGWHFDNSSFAVTLMIQPAKKGGDFEFVRDVRDANANDWGFALSEQIIEGTQIAQTISLAAGDLLLFRGRNSLHRVSPVEDNSTRQLAVLAYNNQPGISLSQNARLTFYGRIGSV